MKKRNYIAYAFLLTLWVVAGLWALQTFSPEKLLPGTLRPVDLLSDVKPRPELPEEALALETLPLAPADSTPQQTHRSRYTQGLAQAPDGVTLIEDFSDTVNDSLGNATHGMDYFYEALANRQTLGRPVRIAYYGDSFIEGDLLTADLRALLQTAFGGCGVGFVDIDSPTAGFRASVRTYASNWESHSVVDKGGFEPSRQGLAERYFLPIGSASLTIQGIPNRTDLHQDTCQQSSLFFYSQKPLTLWARVNRQEAQVFQTEGSDRIQKLQVNGRIGKVTWSVADSLESVFYGATMDATQGIQLDNFSMRGSGGTALRSLPQATLQQFAALRPYDLIIFQFGLNVASEQVQDYSYYTKQMVQVIQKFAKAYPQASILIVGMGDRGKLEQGEVVTMPGVQALNRYQRHMAAQTGCCFWNLFTAMGGEGSMGRMVDEDKPAKANKDYTHINAVGGRYVANLLYKALMAGKDCYEKGGVEP